MTDKRIKVKVVFTIDVACDEKKIFDGQDIAEITTRQVFKTFFERAHLLKIFTSELLDLEKEH